MSKMLKLLNKMNIQRENHGVLIEHRYDTDAVSSNNESHAEVQVDGHHNVLVNFSVIFMVFVAMIAISSIIISYKLLSELNMNKNASQQMTISYNLQKEKIDQLQNSINNLETKRDEAQREFSQSLIFLRNDYEDLRKQNKSVQEDNVRMAAALEDMKMSHKLMVQKYMSISEQIRQVQKSDSNIQK